MILAVHAVSAVGESVQSYAPCQYGYTQYGIAVTQEWPSDRTNVTELRLAPQHGLVYFVEKSPYSQYYWFKCFGGLCQLTPALMSNTATTTHRHRHP